MAKLSGPLFSLGASGKIAGTLVYSVWKGTKYVRQLVIPANPKTASQQTQRGHLTAALTQWHDTDFPLNTLDKTNLNRLSGILGKSMSGFNAYVREYIQTKVAGNTPLKLHDTEEGAPAATTMAIDCNHSSSAVVWIRWGTSKTAMSNIQLRDEAGTPGMASTFSLTGLTASTRYYYQIYHTGAGMHDTLGIGTFDTAA